MSTTHNTHEIFPFYDAMTIKEALALGLDLEPNTRLLRFFCKGLATLRDVLNTTREDIYRLPRMGELTVRCLYDWQDTIISRLSSTSYGVISRDNPLNQVMEHPCASLSVDLAIENSVFYTPYKKKQLRSLLQTVGCKTILQLFQMPDNVVAQTFHKPGTYQVFIKLKREILAHVGVYDTLANTFSPERNMRLQVSKHHKTQMTKAA